MPPGTRPTNQVYTADALERKRMEELRRQLEQSWIAQGNAQYSSPTSTTQINLGSPNYAIPGGPLTQIRPSQIGTPNRNILMAERAEAIRNQNEQRFRRNGPGLSSLQLDPKFRKSNSLADDIEAQIMGLLNKPDIPGQWISPYSQEYLNQLGDRLGQVGSEAQNQFNAAKQQIVDDYSRGVTNRAQAEGGIFNELAANAKNIGVDYAGSSLGKEAIADQNYLNQTASINQANDTAFNDKMGSLAAMLGQTLGMQAKEGLLTPKQWQEGRSGLTAADQAKLGFLENKYNRILDQEEAVGQGNDNFTEMMKYLSQPKQSAEQTSLQKNPLVPQLFSNIKNPQLKNAAQNYYDLGGGDTENAIKIMQERVRELSIPQRLNRNIPAGSTGSLFSNILNNVTNNVATTSLQNSEREQLNQLIEMFRQVSPTYTGVPVTRETKDSSSQNLLTPEMLAMLAMQRR